MHLYEACTVAGLSGVVASTFFFPLVAAGLKKLVPTITHTNDGLTKTPLAPPSFAVCIPAHNESNSISRTLESVALAIQELSRSYPETVCEIFVGANGCTDDTATKALMSGVTVVELPALGKWKTLSTLVDRASIFQWIIFIDSGIVWQSDFLLKWHTHVSHNELTVAYAPTYSNAGAGTLERFSWLLERTLKNIENKSGGPISVHGATVAYRRIELVQAFTLLSEKDQWMNDDVVVPMVLRSMYPHLVVHYESSVEVLDPLGEDVIVEGAGCLDADSAPLEDGVSFKEKLRGEYRRRRRMMWGNLEWLSHPMWRNHLLVSLLAGRRLARMAWMYWVLLFGAGFSGTFVTFFIPFGAPYGGIVTITLLGLGVVVSVLSGIWCPSWVPSGLRVALNASWASLSMPCFLWRAVFSRNRSEKTSDGPSWK
jgi:glycosyltransferase involved in cell wall biosynthesis